MDKNWSYNDCVELLHQIGFLTKNEKSIFQNFKKGRNAVVHDMLNPIKQDVLTEKTLITQFKAGLQAHKIAKRIMMKEMKN